MKSSVTKFGLVLASSVLLTACQFDEVKKSEVVYENLKSTYTDEVPNGPNSNNWKVISYKESVVEPVEERAASILCPPLPQAKPGACYAKISHDPLYKMKSITKMVKEASSKVEIVPAEYETVEEQVMIREAYDELEVVPATYEWVEEQVVDQPAYDRLEEIPAVYVTEIEKVLVSPARSVWKAGTETNVQKVDEATGSVMCLVEIPAVYETKTNKRMVKEATTRNVHVPATYKTVKRRVVKTAETTRVVNHVPAEFTTVKVSKLVKPETERLVEVPAEYEDFQVKELDQEGRCEWREILCTVNATSDRILDIEKALSQAGYNPGTVDGVMDARLFTAARSYQSDRGIAVDPTHLDIINIDTLKALGIDD